MCWACLGGEQQSIIKLPDNPLDFAERHRAFGDQLISAALDGLKMRGEQSLAELDRFRREIKKYVSVPHASNGTERAPMKRL
jgi:hypothetical protein